MAVKVRKRHGAWNKIVSPIVTRLILKKKFNYTYEPCDIKPPYIVLGNHTTDYDAFFIAKSFKNPLYFVMSDHISSLKVGKLIEHLVCPIPITKSTHDAGTVRGIMDVIRQGASVALFPEGNKSFAGEMSGMKPTIGKLLKKLNVPVVIYNIEGGYFSSPRWSKQKRKGRLHGFARKIIMPEELEKMTSEEIFDMVKEYGRVNAYEIQEKNPVEYIGENKAEGIESMLYVCPKCKQMSTLKGIGDEVICCKCDFKATYDNYGYLVTESDKLRLDELDKMQKEIIKNIDFSSFDEDKVITSDEGFDIKKKIDKYNNEDVGVFKLDLYKNRFEFVNQEATIVVPFEDVNGYAIEGQCGIQLSLKDGTVYRFKNPNPVSGLKHVNIYCTITGTEMKF